MFTTRKEVDEHVHKMLIKLPPGSERDVKCFTVARMYHKIREYGKAIEYLNAYLRINDEAGAHKLLAQCYKQVNKPDYRKALEHYQRAIQLNPKQADVISDACQMLLDHSSLYSTEKANYWLELADSHQDQVNKDVLFALRMRSVSGTAGATDPVQSLDMLQKELLLRPTDVALQVRYLHQLLEIKRYDEAFNNAYKTELERPAQCQSRDWYDVVWTVLHKWELLKGSPKDWPYWQLLFITLDRLTQFNLQSNTSSSLMDSITQLFKLDQYLYKFSLQKDHLLINGSSQLYQCCLDHYVGQVLLHAAALLFKRELLANKNKWSNTVNAALPLLLLGYQQNPFKEKNVHWHRHCNDKQQQLVQIWRNQTAFRCAQLGRTLYGCLEAAAFDEGKENWPQNSTQGLWSNSDELLSAARQHCADPKWRSQLYQIMYTHADHKLKEQTSQLMRDQRLQQPLYEWPTLADIEEQEQQALLLAPPILEHHVYLALGAENLAELPRVRFYEDMQRYCKPQKLASCSPDTLCQVDLDVFVYCTVLQAQRMLEMHRETYSNHYSGHRNANALPRMLPFANISSYKDLVTTEQRKWWSIASNLYKNTNPKDNHTAESRDQLHRGLEVVRAINEPRAELIVILQLGKLLDSREDRANLESRIVALYKKGINMLHRHQQNTLEPFYRYFKYPNVDSNNKQAKQLAEDAVNYLSDRAIRLNNYEQFLEEVRGLQLPIIMYLQSESYRTLADSNRTSLAARKNFQDRRLECLKQTKHMLADDLGHPLYALVQRELKVTHSDDVYGSPDAHNNSSTYEDAEDDAYAAAASSANRSLNRSRRQTDPQPAVITELEQTVKQMSKQLCVIKEDVGGGMESMRQDIKSITEKLSTIEDLLKKFKIGSNNSRATPTADVDAAAAVAALGLDDFLSMDDALQQSYLNGLPTSNPQERYYPQTGISPHPNAAYGSPMFNQNAMYNYFANQAQFMRTPPAHGNMPPNFYGPRAPGNYGIPPGVPANLYPNHAGAPLLEGLNYGMTPPTASLVMPQVSQAQAAVSAAPTAGFFNTSQFAQSPMQMPPQVPPVPNQLSFSTPFVPPISSLAPPATTQHLPATVPTPIVQPKTLPAVAPIVAAATAPAVIPATIPAAIPFPALANLTPAVVVPVSKPTPSVVAPVQSVFNRALNNQPVEKEPPANVVITNSDPLPKPAVAASAQPTFSVTIPPQHLKPSLVQAAEPPVVPSGEFKFNNTTTNTGNIFSGLATSTFSFKTQVAQAAAEKQKELAAGVTRNESISSDQNQSADATTDPDYDPRPDFQGIIPLPDEVEVRTGEEDEQVLFSYRSKLFRHSDREWKERGIGIIKILKNQSAGTSRILMRRDQTHKICANHQITASMVLTTPDMDKEEKSFIWAANDFADEIVQLEKFLVRFKLPETAKQFKLAFEVAVKEAANIKSDVKPVTFGIEKNTFVTSTPAGNPLAKQAEPLKVNSVEPTTDTVVAKSLFGNVTTKTSNSPFANFSFGSATNGASANTGNLSFGSVSATPDTSVTSNNITAFTTAFNFGSNAFSKADSTLQKEAPKQDVSTPIVSEGDSAEDYVSTAQFAPVIPLPELVEVVTGEENELVLFEHRAKLLRFEKETNEWKERGLGNIKLLQLKSDLSQVRLLMRREQVLKICCNQRLSPDTKFTYMKNSQNALTWAGQDFAEEELTTELLCVRFKTAETCKEFLDAVLKAQASIAEKKPGQELNTKAEKDSKPTAKGFSDALKPKAGSWSCQACYTTNGATQLFCLACEAPKEDVAMPIPNALNLSTTATKGFGDAFKPKAGSWNCQACYTSNAATQLYCLACEAPKDDTVPAKPQTLQEPTALNLTSTANKFTFGFTPTGNTTAPSLSGFTFGAKQTTDNQKPQDDPLALKSNIPVSAVNFSDMFKNKLAVEETTAKAPSTAGFGDAFKPKAGSWSCNDCYSNNDGTQLYCLSCEAPKDATVPKKENKLDTSAGITFSTASKFSFGFGAPTAATTTSATSFFGTNSPFSGDAVKTSSSSDESTKILFSNNKNEGSTVSSSSSFSFMPTTTASGNTLASSTFSFAMPKTQQQQPKSPAAIAGSGDANNEDENHLEEESTAYFAPVIPLPDMIDVKTGEENEDLLYVHRAKLYRLSEDGEWKERGLGNVKILRQKDTKKLRVVMRREQVLKICLNHLLNSSVFYKAKDEKSWLFAVHDFSEGESVLERFALRFKNKDIAQAFYNSVQSALDGTAEPIKEEESPDTTKLTPNKPLTEPLAVSNEIKNLSINLSQSSDFLTTQSNCAGCRGCEPEKFDYGQPAQPKPLKEPLPMTLPALKLPVSEPKEQSQLQNVSTASTQSPLLKASSLAVKPNNTSSSGSFAFGDSDNAVSATTTVPSTTLSANTAEIKPSALGGGFLFGNTELPVFGQASLQFGGTGSGKPQQSLFGGNFVKDNNKGSIFGSINENNKEEEPKNLFNQFDTKAPTNTFNFFNAAAPVTFGNIANDNKVVSFADMSKEKVKDNKENIAEVIETKSINAFGTNNFADLGAKASDDFASLAAKTTGNPIGFQKSETGGFFNLTHQDAFKNFRSPTTPVADKSSDNDENYDPHYDPIIALPSEIVVSTGEEDETKLFGERSTLYRYNADTKEWKERGVGELKILKHATLNTYRMVMRREQILKLVLNMKIGSNFTIDYMDSQHKSFVWASVNYAESPDGEVESLACRFKKSELAEAFYSIINKCIQDAKATSSDAMTEQK